MSWSLRISVAIVSVIVYPAVARAHQFWIEASAYLVEAPGLLRAQVLNGEEFRGDPLARREEHIARYAAIGPNGTELPMLGRAGHPHSIARATQPGLHRIVYQSVENHLTLPPRDFDAYLLEEGLGRIIGQRYELGESDAPAREVYVRCAKALVVAAEADGSAPQSSDSPSGLPMEIVLQGPARPEVGVPASAVLMRDGRPVGAGLRIVAMQAGNRPERHELFTDSDGRVAWTPRSPGRWLLAGIEMERLEGRADADWRSFWVSVTFEAIETGALANSR
jgi:uncharacterized GH25 family protein